MVLLSPLSLSKRQAPVHPSQYRGFFHKSVYLSVNPIAPVAPCHAADTANLKSYISYSKASWERRWWP